MDSSHTRGMFVAILGTFITAASIGTLIWDPGGNGTFAIAVLLLITTFLGLGLVVAGANKVLSDRSEDGE